MTNQPSLNISVREFKALLDPVMPCVADDYNLPVINAVHVKSCGPWLVAEATDRFRVGIHRMRSVGDDWPEWEAIIPARSLKSLFSTFKPSRGFDPEVSLVIDGDELIVETTGGLSGGLFTQARMAYPLQSGEYPKIATIAAAAIAATPEAGDRRFNWNYLAAFKAADPRGIGLTIHAGPVDKPLLVTNGDNFIGILMPRKDVNGKDGSSSAELDLSDWADILAPAPVASEAGAA